MTKPTDIDALIAEARNILFSDSPLGYEETEEGDLILRLTDALESSQATGRRILADALAESETLRAELAHQREVNARGNRIIDDLETELRQEREVIEKAEDWVSAHYLDTSMGAKVLEILATYYQPTILRDHVRDLTGETDEGLDELGGFAG